jgi:hypothetical protein
VRTVPSETGVHTQRFFDPLGTDIKVQQDLLRHSSARLTLDTYTQSVTPAKREAQNAVIALLTAPEPSTFAAPTGTQ